MAHRLSLYTYYYNDIEADALGRRAFCQGWRTIVRYSVTLTAFLATVRDQIPRVESPDIDKRVDVSL